MDITKLNGWLQNTVTIQEEQNYTHRLLQENLEHRQTTMAELQQTIQRAHEDTKRHLRELAGYSLDPFDTPTVTSNEASNDDLDISRRDPTQGYPERLELKTLKGFFGEIFAGIVAENFSHFNIDGWKVPVYPFRFHRSAFHQLERWRQTESEPGTTPGRTGDDMLAFYRDADGTITHSLVCEAKCSKDHNRGLIDSAHRQASGKEPRPVDILNLIDILRDYDDPESQQWKTALQVLYSRNIRTDYERFDLVSYICGTFPKRTTTWMESDAPNPNYTAGRKLESVEIHLHGVDELIREVYNGHSR